jgi:hypothetical protein
MIKGQYSPGPARDKAGLRYTGDALRMPNLGYLNARHWYRLRVSSLLPAEAGKSEAFSAKESKIIALRTSKATSQTPAASNDTWTQIQDAAGDP